MIRVLLVCDWFLKYVAPLACALQRQGVSVAVLCRDHALEFGGSRDERAEAVRTIRDSGARVLELPGRITSLDAVPHVARAFAAIRGWSPDLVHAQPNADPRLMVAAQLRPVVLTVHDPTPHPGAPRPRRVDALVREAWAWRARRIIVHGDALRVELAGSRLGRHVSVVPHGTTTLRDALPPPPEPRVLLFGRLQAYKGAPLLLQAMHLVWHRRPDVKLVIAGEGPATAHISESDRVELHRGYLPESALDEIFRSASLVVLPYLQGSQSGVGTLAVGRGIPAVVARVGSLPELATRDTLLVSPGDAPALARAILANVDHDASLREETIARARERFSWERVADLTVGVYRSVLAGEADR